jgi:hypothetical protein
LENIWVYKKMDNMQVPLVLNQQSYRDMMGYHGDATKDRDVVVEENEVYPEHCLCFNRNNDDEPAD